MGMGQELNKQCEWERESIRIGMGMTPIPIRMYSHQRLRKIVVEYSNKWLIQYLLIYGATTLPVVRTTHLSRIT